MSSATLVIACVTGWLLPAQTSVEPAEIPPEISEAPGRPGGIVAIVGSDPITQSELDRRIMLRLTDRGGRISPTALKEQKPALERAILDQMIDDLLILQAAWELGESAPDPGRPPQERKNPDGPKHRSGDARGARSLRYVGEMAVDREIDSRLEKLRQNSVNLSSREEFYRFMRQSVGLNRQEIRAFLADELAIRRFLWDQLWRFVDPFVAPRISKHYYSRHVQDFSRPVEVSFRQIFILPDRVNSFVAMKAIDEGLGRGEDFVELARKWSMDFDQPEDRGRVWKKSFEELESWRDPIPERLRTMEKGKIEGPIVTTGGVYFLRLEERIEGKPKPYEEVQQEIERAILAGRRERAYRQFIRRARERTAIQTYIEAGAGADGAAPESTPEPADGEGVASGGD